MNVNSWGYLQVSLPIGSENIIISGGSSCPDLRKVLTDQCKINYRDRQREEPPGVWWSITLFLSMMTTSWIRHRFFHGSEFLPRCLGTVWGLYFSSSKRTILWNTLNTSTTCLRNDDGKYCATLVFTTPLLLRAYPIFIRMWHSWLKGFRDQLKLEPS